MPDMVSCLCSVPSSASPSNQWRCEKMAFMSTTHSAGVTCASDLEYAASRLRRRYARSFSVALRRWPNQPYSILDIGHVCVMEEERDVGVRGPWEKDCGETPTFKRDMFARSYLLEIDQQLNISDKYLTRFRPAINASVMRNFHQIIQSDECFWLLVKWQILSCTLTFGETSAQRSPPAFHSIKAKCLSTTLPETSTRCT